MRTDYFHFKKSDQGTEYVIFSEGITKTRQSGLHNKHRLVIPKMFVTDTERCLVRFCKLYLFKRLKCLQNNGPFCLSVIKFDFFSKQDAVHFNDSTVNFKIQAKISPKRAVKHRRVNNSDDSSQK